jgi:hypothetical protein
MDDRPTDRPAAESARRPARARRSSPPPAPPDRVKVQLTIEGRVKHWLEVHSLGDGVTLSELVTRIIDAQPTRHYLSTRQARPGLTIARQADQLDQLEQAG